MDMDGEGTNVAARWRVGEWLADGSMEAVAEINAQCLDFLCQLAAGPATGICARRMPEMFVGQVDAWRALSPAARVQLAASPYLLVEAGFDDAARWALPARRMVQDLAPVQREPVFSGPDSEVFIRSVLVLGWHLARANRQLARVMLGMSPACAVRVAALKLRDLDWVVVNHPGWVRPRWERQPRVWRHLLGAALDSDTSLLTQVSLRGLQLMAAGVLAPGARPGPGAAV
jgi:hypothetical protein